MGKVTRRAEKGKVLSLMPAERAFVGVDVHKRTYHVAVWTEDRGSVASWVEPSDPQLLIGRLGLYKALVGKIVHEAGPTGYGLVRAFCAFAGGRGDRQDQPRAR